VSTESLPKQFMASTCHSLQIFQKCFSANPLHTLSSTHPDLVVAVKLLSQYIASIFDSPHKMDIVPQNFIPSFPGSATFSAGASSAGNDGSVYEAQSHLDVEHILEEINMEFGLDEVEGDLYWRRKDQFKQWREWYIENYPNMKPVTKIRTDSENVDLRGFFSGLSDSRVRDLVLLGKLFRSRQSHLWTRHRCPCFNQNVASAKSGGCI
jgi:hypothetical protein